MRKSLKGKVIFITGGTSGIGRAAVIACLREGAKVVFTGRRDEKADEIKQHVTDNGCHDLELEAEAHRCKVEDLHFVQNDITNESGLKAAIQEAVDKFGGIDGVFANAGRHMVGSIEDTTLEQRRDMFAIDVEGVFLTLKYTIPHMKKKGGSIVLMGSDQCLIGKGESAAYGAAKGAVGQMTKSTAIDYAKYKIRVNCVCPGTIDTPLARGAMQGFADKNFGGDFDKGYAFLEKAQPIQRLGTAEEVAELVTFMLSNKAEFMTGSLVSIDGGYVAG